MFNTLLELNGELCSTLVKGSDMNEVKVCKVCYGEENKIIKIMKYILKKIKT